MRLQRKKFELLSIQQNVQHTHEDFETQESIYDHGQNARHYDEGEITHQGSLEYSRTDELNFRAISRASELPLEQTGIPRQG